MNPKLTRRQQQFLCQFLDQYQELKQPLPYPEVARRLGIGNVTAYEMLRILEEHRLIHSEYETQADSHGPGRPAVLFSPTDQANQLFQQVTGDPQGQQDWENVKAYILQQIRDGKAGGYQPLLDILMARVAERRSPLIFVTELIAAFLLALSTLPQSPELAAVTVRLQKVGLPGEISLSGLSGIGLVFSSLERANRHFFIQLLTLASRYENMFLQLTEENRQRMCAFAREVTQILYG
jgi:hypothetical protein